MRCARVVPTTRRPTRTGKAQRGPSTSSAGRAREQPVRPTTATIAGHRVSVIASAVFATLLAYAARLEQARDRELQKTHQDARQEELEPQRHRSKGAREQKIAGKKSEARQVQEL